MMHWKRHFKPILFLFVMILAQTVFNNADITMLGLMKGDYEVGIYSTAFKIKNILSQVIISLAWVVMPRISIYFSMNEFDKINDLLKKALTVMVTLGFPCIAGCIALSNEIVEVVGGEAYANASIPLIILMLSFAIDLFGGSFLGNMVCLPSKQEMPFVESCCLAAILNVILNYILIPHGGASAAAFTSAIAIFIVAMWLYIKRDRRIKITYIPEVIKAPVIGSLFIVFICVIVRMFITDLWIKLILCITISAIGYFIVLLCMGSQIVRETISTLLNKINL